MMAMTTRSSIKVNAGRMVLRVGFSMNVLSSGEMGNGSACVKVRLGSAGGADD